MDKILFYVGRITFASSNCLFSFRLVCPQNNLLLSAKAMSIEDFVPIALSLFAVGLAVWFDKNKRTMIRIVGISVTRNFPRAKIQPSRFKSEALYKASARKEIKPSSILRFFSWKTSQ